MFKARRGLGSLRWSSSAIALFLMRESPFHGHPLGIPPIGVTVSHYIHHIAVNRALENIAVLGTLQISLVHVQLFFCSMIQVG